MAVPELITGSGHRVHHILVDGALFNQAVQLPVDRRDSDGHAPCLEFVQDLARRHVLSLIFLKDLQDLISVF